MCRALHRLLPRGVQIPDGSNCVVPAHKMPGQFCCQFSCPWLIARLKPVCDLLMPPHAPPHWHPLVEHLAIQSVEKSIAGGHGTVGPGVRPAHPHKLSVAGEGGTPLLDLPNASIHGCCQRGHGKLPPATLAASSKRCSSTARCSICRSSNCRRVSGRLTPTVVRSPPTPSQSCLPTGLPAALAHPP